LSDPPPRRKLDRLELELALAVLATLGNESFPDAPEG
jgi:hypothetical protein